MTIGCGVNLSNEEPTKCINEMARAKNLQPISREVLLARIFNLFEGYLHKIDIGEEEDIFKLYHLYWLHSGQIVKLQTRTGSMKEGKIISIDHDGFLSVQIGENEVVSVQPDGNSFDMLQGLIISKDQ